ncbi:MAG: iron ABC transporter substrate-binding protein [Actinobacteria bacterium]|nr:iron ABC transporter substrate-binding protein [Actinomycetota bacterium]
MRRRFQVLLGITTVAALTVLSGCSADSGDGADQPPEGALTVYSGRTENLIGPLMDDFTEQTGIPVAVRYGQSADLALQIDTEGDSTPADVYISQSPGAAGYLADQGRLQQLSKKTLAKVQKRFEDPSGHWVGMSGRVRVMVYNTDTVTDKQFPKSVFDLTGEEYRGKVALAPANGSFQDFVTAMRIQFGKEKTQQWLDGMAANESPTYANNTAIVEAAARGEVPMGLVNHYYNERAKVENASTPTENYFFPDGDIGSLLIATAVGVVNGTDQASEADKLVAFLLSEQAQEFFANETFEYPLAEGVAPPHGLPPLDSLDYTSVDLGKLGEGFGETLQMIEASGLNTN